MKLTVVVLLGLIGVAIALHNTGSYGNNGDGGHKHHKSSESSSSSKSGKVIPPPPPKKCKLICTSNAVFLDRVPTAKACNSGDPEKLTSDVLQCPTCCQGWGLQRGVSKDSIVSHIIGDTPADFKCVCCQRKCE
uniref:Uncharacterized protein n=1 Tax=Panagrolaimus sp. PS1159 TaxID=55785 RepID=A0AC35FIG2_9BILA